jgi:hypothetical protein
VLSDPGEKERGSKAPKGKDGLRFEEESSSVHGSFIGKDASYFASYISGNL